MKMDIRSRENRPEQTQRRRIPYGRALELLMVLYRFRNFPPWMAGKAVVTPGKACLRRFRPKGDTNSKPLEGLLLCNLGIHVLQLLRPIPLSYRAPF